MQVNYANAKKNSNRSKYSVQLRIQLGICIAVIKEGKEKSMVYINKKEKRKIRTCVIELNENINEILCI